MIYVYYEESFTFRNFNLNVGTSNTFDAGVVLYNLIPSLTRHREDTFLVMYVDHKTRRFILNSHASRLNTEKLFIIYRS